jgi:hypothetical protein
MPVTPVIEAKIIAVVPFFREGCSDAGRASSRGIGSSPVKDSFRVVVTAGAGAVSSTVSVAVRDMFDCVLLNLAQLLLEGKKRS